MNQRKKYLAKNTALFALNSVGTKLISFFLVPIYTAALVTSDYGTADLVTTIATIVVPILTLNIGEAVMRFCLDENSDSNKIMSIAITIAAISVLFSLLSIPITEMFAATKGYGKYIAMYCIVQGIYQVVACYLRGTEQLNHFAISNIIHVLITALCSILFLLVFKTGLEGYFQAYIVGYAAGIIYGILAGRIHRVLFHFSFDKKLFVEMAKYSIVLVPTSFMWWIMNSSDRIMVTSMVGIAANGIYAISYKIPTVLSTMSTVFNQAWSYSAIKEDKSSDREDFNNKMFRMFFNFQVLITAGITLIVKPFLHYYVSESYYSAWMYMPYLLYGYLFMSLGTFLSTTYTVNKDSKAFLISGTSGAVVNVILNAILIPRLGVSGAAIATCISYITVFTYRAFDTRRYLIIKIFTMKFWITQILLLAMLMTLFINSSYEMILLLVEFILILILEKEFVKSILHTFWGILKKRGKKKNG